MASAEDLLTAARGMIILVVIVAIVLIITSGSLTDILGLKGKVPGEGLNLTATFQQLSCTGSTLNMNLFIDVVDADRNSFHAAPVITVGSTTWWLRSETQEATFEVSGGETDGYLLNGAMDLTDVPQGNLFATLTLWAHPPGTTDCLATEFNKGSRKDIYGGALDAGEESKRLHNLLTQCASQFIAQKDLTAEVTC